MFIGKVIGYILERTLWNTYDSINTISDACSVIRTVPIPIGDHIVLVHVFDIQCTHQSIITNVLIFLFVKFWLKSFFNKMTLFIVLSRWYFVIIWYSNEQ